MINKIAWAFLLLPMLAAGQVINPGGAGSGTVSGQASGVVPLGTSSTAISNQSHLSDNGTVVGSSLPIAFPDATQQSSAAYNTQKIILSPNCPAGSSSCVQLFADTKIENDCTTNGTTTVTCPSGNFSQATDAGKVFWATTRGSGTGLYLFTTFLCPQTTIASVTNSTTIVLSNACTGSATGTSVAIWGHNDGATLAGLNIGSSCTTLQIGTGAGMVMFDRAWGIGSGISGCINFLTGVMGAPRASFLADGFNGSQPTFVMTPNFTWSGCTGTGDGTRTVCVGSAFRGITNLNIWGTGLTPASNTNCANATNKTVLMNSGSGNMSGVDLAGICPGQSSLAGIEVNGQDNFMDEGGAQDVGQYACLFFGQDGESSRGNDCHNLDAGAGNYGEWITGGAKVTQFASTPIRSVLIDGNSTLISIGTTYLANTGATSAVEVTSGSFFYSYGDSITGNGNTGLLVDSGGFAYMNGTPHSGAPPAKVSGTMVTTSSTYAGAMQVAGGVVQSNGGNKFSSIPTAPTAGGTYGGVGVLMGSCRGTATSSATLGLYGMGQQSTFACTSTTTTAGQVVQQLPLSGSVFGLYCTATHAGVNASSGVVTLLKNGSSTISSGPMTCTIGTGTSCSDFSHFDVPTPGDMYSIQFTTQGSEVLAGVTCTVLAW